MHGQQNIKICDEIYTNNFIANEANFVRNAVFLGNLPCESGAHVSVSEIICLTIITDSCDDTFV